MLGLLGVGTSTMLVPRSRLVVVGDSWAAGLHADPRHALGQVAAADLDWSAEVDAVSGTGYLNDAGGGGTYATRLERVAGPSRARIVVLQGGSNDDRQDLEALPAGVEAALGAATSRFPEARRVLVGPGPDPAPVTGMQRRVDRILQRTAAEGDVPYISVLQLGWIPPTDPARIIDPRTRHPTAAGQRYLGHRLSAALRRLFPDLVG